MKKSRNARLRRMFGWALFFFTLRVFFAGGANAGETFSVKEFSPRGEVTEAVNIKIDFSTAVAASDDVGRILKAGEMPVVFNPPVAGRGAWISRSSFVFHLPSGRLREATQFSATIPSKLKDASGRELTGNNKFLFNTPPLEFIGMEQTGYIPEPLDGCGVEYQLNFNAPINPANLESTMIITNAKGEEIPFYLESYGSSNSVRIRVTPEDGSSLDVKIASGLTSSSGPLPMKTPVAVSIGRDLSLKITDSSVNSDYSSSYIYIRTTSEVDIEKAGSFIEVSPPVKYNVSLFGSGIGIRGDFPPRELITVKLKKGLPATRGPGLAEEWTRTFVFPDYEPSLEFASSGRFISPANDELIVPFSAVNIETLSVSIRRVYDNNVSFALRNEWPYYLDNLDETIYYDKFEVSAKPNEETEFAIDLGKILGGRTGVFMIRASADDSWRDVHRVINVTDIGGSAKIGGESVLVWANSISEGKPLKNIKVDIYSNSNQIIASGETDEHGVCLIKRDSKWEGDLFPSLAILKNGGDVSVLHLWGNIWQTGNEDYTGVPYLNGKYYGYLYTPRGIFRPGETVPVHMLVRTGNLSPETPFPVQLKVFTPLGREWSASSVMLSDMGLASAEVEIGDAGPTGIWNAAVYIPGDNTPISSKTFIVEDFAPPKIEVAVSSYQEELFFGDEPALKISAKYLFGAAGDGLSYEVDTTLIPREYSHPDWQYYSFYDNRVVFTPNNNLSSNGTLNSDGAASVVLDHLSHNAASYLDAVFRVGVREDGGRWVYKNLSVPYYPRDTFLGIKTPQGEITTNTSIPLAFAAIDKDGKALSPKNVSLSISREYLRSIVTTVDGKRRSEIQRENIPLEGFENVPVEFIQGRANADVTFKVGGRYNIVLEDSDGKARAAISIYAYDSRWAYDVEGDATLPESLSITLDKDIYKAGDRATATVSGAFDGTVLLSVETDKVLFYDTSASENKNAKFSFEITEDMAPNAWVTAHLIRAAVSEDAWSAHRAFGAAPVNLNCENKKLTVEIESPEKINPAENNAFKIRLKDSNGNGARGEISVMLVDESVLGLTNFKTPNFYDYYVRKRGLNLPAYDIYAELMPLYLSAPRVLAPGGGDEYSASEQMMKASMSPVRADRFKILTIVKRIFTDENGVADFSFDVPEFAGQARLMAVASAKTAFGSAESVHTIARDVVADVTLPRAIAPLDEFESQVQLFNRTGEPLEVTVELKVSGPLSIAEVSGKTVSPSSGMAKRYSSTIELPVAERAFSIPLVIKAENSSGVAGVSLLARNKDVSQEQNIEIAIRPPYPRISQTGAISVKAGDTNALELPTDWFPGTRRAVVSMSALPSISIAEAARFLLDYPYYCLEQTVSRGWALLALPDLVARIDTNLATRGQLDYALTQVLMKIQSMQLYNGAFSPWAQSEADSWVSVYTTHFLVACEKRGIQVPRETLKNALGYLRYLLAQNIIFKDKIEYGASYAVRAYISYVLALEGDAPLGFMSFLKDKSNEIRPYGRMLLAAAYAAANDTKTAMALVGEKAPPIVSYDGSEQLNFDSPLRTTALYLMVWNEIDPESANAVMTAADLLSALQASRWYTTQEAGWAVLALADFYSYHQVAGAAVLELSEEKSGVLAVASADNSVAQIISRDISRLNITNVGNGTGYATWTADGVPSHKPMPEDKGMKTLVRYTDKDGIDITGGGSIAVGERIYGKITVRALAGELKNIVVVLPFAGGLEIENPEITDAPEVSENDEDYEYYAQTYRTSRTELRDDRLLLFVDYVGRRAFEWKFTMRAITRGTFTLPPIAAEGMYSPGTRSVGETSVITVK
ncbi:MAG: hypothetical protein LBB28_01445 [Synergistaceae bacterium]|nr:hypothetical protein [Synergistaceae bacterium]